MGKILKKRKNNNLYVVKNNILITIGVKNIAVGVYMLCYYSIKDEVLGYQGYTAKNVLKW